MIRHPTVPLGSHVALEVPVANARVPFLLGEELRDQIQRRHTGLPGVLDQCGRPVIRRGIHLARTVTGSRIE